MKHPIVNFLRKFLLLIAVLVPLSVSAQPGDDDGLPEDPDDPDAIPIDGGISLLAAAGMAYGGKKIYDMRKHKKKHPGQSDQDVQ